MGPGCRKLGLLLLLVSSSAGCHFGRWQTRPHPSTSHGIAEVLDLPREKDKAIYNAYVIEPPDVLSITAIRLIPKAPYRLQIGDTIVVEVLGTIPAEPIRGVYPVQIGGVVNLGFSYGTVTVRNLTVEEAEEAIRNHLLDIIRNPVVTVSLGNIAASQQITGPRLVAQDGRVNLGVYGTVKVVGMTKAEAKEAIEKKLAETLDEPEVAIDIQNYNSKFYYVIFQGAGLGDTIRRVPVTGNETVLDAIAAQGRIAQQSSNKIWIARPARDRKGHDQILLVDWLAITQLGETDTNYQILPGDRVYIAEKVLIRLDNDLRTLFRPVFTVGQFINFMLGTIRNVNAGVGGAAPQAFQNLGGGFGGFGTFPGSPGNTIPGGGTPF